jgi:ATP-dependent Clp protease ATP-binding subunit ClpA
MFERFTEKARQVVVSAQDEARLLKHNYISTEHILLGLLQDKDTLAYRALNAVHNNIGLYQIRNDIARIVGQGDDVVDGQIPFTPRGKKVLELALREALSLGHNYVGSEHVLLGLVRENEGVAARLLLDYQADADSIREAVLIELAKDVPDAEIEQFRHTAGLTLADAEAAIAEYKRLKPEAEGIFNLVIDWEALSLGEARTLVSLLRKGSLQKTEPTEQERKRMILGERYNIAVRNIRYTGTKQAMANLSDDELRLVVDLLEKAAKP